MLIFEFFFSIERFFSVAKPEQIVSDSFDSNLFRYSSTTTNELQILHTYTLHNKGPSDAKRTEVKFMWPMLPLNGFNEQMPLLTNVDLPTIIRVSEPKSKNDRCFVSHSSIYQLTNVDENEKNPFFDRLRSTVTNQIESSSNLSSLFCHGSICKTFICQIDTLPIGQSVLIQLKATLKTNLFRSVKRKRRKIVESCFFFSFSFRNSIEQNRFSSFRMAVLKFEKFQCVFLVRIQRILHLFN